MIDPQRYQGPVHELRPTREHSITQIVTPDGVAAVAAEAPRELLLGMFTAAVESWNVALGIWPRGL